MENRKQRLSVEPRGSDGVSLVQRDERTADMVGHEIVQNDCRRDNDRVSDGPNGSEAVSYLETEWVEISYSVIDPTEGHEEQVPDGYCGRLRIKLIGHSNDRWDVLWICRKGGWH